VSMVQVMQLLGEHAWLVLLIRKHSALMISA
jgi:hypothetical protein